jgi:hypothetical protein
VKTTLTPGKEDVDRLEFCEEERKSCPALPAHWVGGGALFTCGRGPLHKKKSLNIHGCLGLPATLNKIH